MEVLFAAVAVAAEAAWGEGSEREEAGFADAVLPWAWTAVDSWIMSSDESTQVYRTGRSPQTFWVALRPLEQHWSIRAFELQPAQPASSKGQVIQIIPEQA